MLSCIVPRWPRAQVTPLPAQKIVADSPSQDDEDSLKRLNDSSLPISTIEDIAADHLRHPAKLKQEQERLLKIVQNSRDSERHKVAAANAISILKETGFSFQGISLKDVSIPSADLSNTVLDGVDFSGADLTGVNFSNSSLQGAKFNRANCNQVNFGIDFILKHEWPVMDMAMFPDQKRLVSYDLNRHYYIWNIENQQLIKKIPKKSYLNHFDGQPIVFSSDRKYFLSAYVLKNNQSKRNTVMIDIVDTESLTCISQELLISDLPPLNLFALTANGHYITAYGKTIDIWELNTDLQGTVRFECRVHNVIDNLQLCAYNHETNRLVIYTGTRFELISLPDLQLIESFGIPPEFSGSITALEFTSIGDALLFAHKNQVYKWNIDQKQPELLFSDELIAPEENMRTPLKIELIKSISQSSLISYFSQTGEKREKRNWREGNYKEENRVLGKISIRDIENPTVLVFEDDFVGYAPTNINTILQEKKSYQN